MNDDIKNLYHNSGLNYIRKNIRFATYFFIPLDFKLV